MFFLLSMLTPALCRSQVKGDVLLTLELDMVKSDYGDYFQRSQCGIEGNYFISEHFSATGGVDYWTASSQVVGVIGGRWFPVKEAFIRGRALFGAKDISIGGGWTRPLNQYWRFEAMGDVYFKGQIAIRAGITYIFRKSYQSSSM